MRNPFKGAGRDGIQDKGATCPTTEKAQCVTTVALESAFKQAVALYAP